MTASAAPAAPGDVVVDVRGASFAYGPRLAVNGVSFHASAGELVGLVGPNGAGKSTLIRLVAGLLAPSAGSVRLAGLDPAAAPRRVVARVAALVPQEPRVAWPFTVREAVMMGRAPRQGLLDEPTAFLDLAHQMAAMRMAEVAARGGLCVVAVLHDLNLAAASCGRLVVLSRGSVVAEGGPADVLTADRVREVWGVRVWRGRNGETGSPVVLPVRGEP